ncbi:alpha/beta hydrolase fold protein [Aspergillus vadensis CBS 113365]|uniref:Alpha/beta hydrolase fold protein n=1 Tax=Aspergillus vadensis (strain CBS 113365 / IMI 142717 / IBT 24658) TaxID=1448311 RepID=A0A319BKJ1_ASPVC|nr:alpha/beta hydrolase fold protein [Aspergillus vadensis CBS 113365]PYH73217.1 alpha/beta hydrolase fold protein [Aspergillus vadensis CBS 113365]
MKEQADTTTAESPPPLWKVRMPFWHRVDCFIRLWLLKSLAAIYFYCRRLVRQPPRRYQPTFVRRYPSRPMLNTRIFFPPNYRAGERLPLYLNIHGGGFAVGDAQVDDRFCVAWAGRTGMLVVSLDYRRVPRHPFPTATYDLVAQIKDVLADESLPIDPERITIGGFSAGGNLALSVSQLPPLHGRVKAAVVYYPIVDFGHPPPVKLASRPYTDGPLDKIGMMAWALDWGYVYLPPRIYMIAAQWDMLRLEGQQMIHRLAGLHDKEDQEAPFETSAYKWTLARGCTHGFTHGFTHGQEGNAAERTYRKKVCEDIYGQAHEWLKSVLA